MLPPGAVIMLTAAVRDLHLAFPGQFLTDVRTSAPPLWLNNPWITPLDDDDPEVEIIDCDYPLIHRSNRVPYHFVHAVIDNLSDRLGVAFGPTRCGGDLHVSAYETECPSQVEESTGLQVPFWIIAPGWNSNFTVKHWSAARYQEIIDAFRGRVLFVHVGHNSPRQLRLSGVLDLTGQTNLRQLVRLLYRSQGVLCPVNLMMHLSAAVETTSGDYRRPCVIVAGGREPPQWEAYPHHQYLHTVGALSCCANGGCWRARAFRLGDGTAYDQPNRLCVDVVANLPRCMHMIRSSDVIEAIQRYFDGGVVSYLRPEEAAACELAISTNMYQLDP
jgi:Glycosyltransferase family 9 (heptosyltransferase)